MAATASLLVIVCFGLLPTSKATESDMNQSTVTVLDTAGDAFTLSNTVDMPPMSATSGGTVLDPRIVDKYVDFLVVPPPLQVGKSERGKLNSPELNLYVAVCNPRQTAWLNERSLGRCMK
jgi:hypothetical protein